MPEITKPLYVQYTGNKNRLNCCTECRKLLNEGDIPIDRNGEFFNRINFKGKGVYGQETRVRYILGDCKGLTTNCKNCYYVKEVKTGVEFLYKNIDGEMCDQDPPFSENLTIAERTSAEERLKNLKELLKSLTNRLQLLYDQLEKIEKDIRDNRKKYNKHLEFKRLLSLQTQDSQTIARNKKAINKEIVDLGKEINETGNYRLQEILYQKLDFLKDLLAFKYSFTKIEKVIDSQYADDFISTRFPNAASKKGEVFDPIIKGYIEAETQGLRGKSTKKTIQRFVINTAGASPTSGTTPVTIIGNDNSTGHYITSATYNNVTGIVDFIWNIEPEIIENNQPQPGQVKYAVITDRIMYNVDEYAVQLDLANPTGNAPDDPIPPDISGTYLQFLKRLDKNKEDMFETRGDIEETEGRIIKTELELSIKNNILSTLDKNTFDDAINTISEYARYIKNALARNRQ